MKTICRLSVYDFPNILGLTIVPMGSGNGFPYTVYVRTFHPFVEQFPHQGQILHIFLYISKENSLKTWENFHSKLPFHCDDVEERVVALLPEILIGALGLVGRSEGAGEAALPPPQDSTQL